MSTNRWPDNESLQRLLADRATEGLDANAQRELDELIEAAPPFEVEAYDLAAALVEMALTLGTEESVPDALRRKLEADADRFAQASAQPPDLDAAPERPKRVDVIGRLGWLAAAAGIAIAVFTSLPTKDSTAEQRRERLLASGGEVVQLPWKALESERFGDITGDVVWSTPRQEGYMRIAGIPANDPAKQQYQLWIVDPSRDTEPIDGGVFDVPADGEVIVPIDAKLRANAPVAFALTLEKPGGVVEHDPADGPLLVIAQVQ